MADNNLNNAQADALVNELKKRFATVNGYLKGDIQNIENIKELYDRRLSYQIEKLQFLIDSKSKRSLVKRVFVSTLVCLATAILIVYSGIFDFGNLFPPMTDLASAINASKHDNIIFDWILPISITTLILFVVNIIVLGMIVSPIAKMCDTALANIHLETQSSVASKQLINEISANVMQLDQQHIGLNKILDGMIKTEIENNNKNAVESILDLKNSLMSHAIEHHRYYSVIVMQLSK